jgi:long-chain acyl-CoA synthetase
VPPGQPGLLYFEDTTGRGIVYHNSPEAAADLHIAPGVFTLGEIGYVDDDGFVYITDRASDLVVSGGVNIYPAESEQVLIIHDAVVDVSCIGIPDPEMGERLVALVVRHPDVKATEAELVAYCRGRLTHYKCPREVQFVDTVGRTAAGKVNKRTLRDEFCSAAR